MNIATLLSVCELAHITRMTERVPSRLRPYRKAPTACRFELELSDGTRLPATMVQLSDVGMALVSINPKRLPSSWEKRDKLNPET